MRLFRQIREAEHTVSAIPERPHQELAQQAMAHQVGDPGRSAPTSDGLGPIAGVDLTLYARIVKAIAPQGYDQALLPGVAASHEIDAEHWQLAHDGWNRRIQMDPAAARAFSDAYRAV